MSEFRQVTASVEALETRVALLQQSVTDNSEDITLEESFSFILVRSGYFTAQYSLQTHHSKLVSTVPPLKSVYLHLYRLQSTAM